MFYETTLKRFNVEILNTALSIPLCDQTGKPVHNIRMHGNTIVTENILTDKYDLLYNWDWILLKNRNYLIVTNSIFNVWWLWQIGFPYVVAILNSNISNLTLAYLDSVTIKSGTLWVITDKSPAAIAKGATIAGALSRIRFARHIVLEQIVGTCHDDIQKHFNECT